MIWLIRASLCAVAFAAVAAAAPVAHAQLYPAKPVRLIVPFPPGGGTDFFARTIGGKMSEHLGQPIVIENRPGAGTIIGAEAAAKAAPDGYTLLLGDNATYATNPVLRKKLPYDPLKDFVPVTLTGRFALLLVVSPPLTSASSLGEFIDFARKQPGRLNYSSPPPGGPHHLAMEYFNQRAGIEMTGVHFQGAAPAMQELLGARLPAMFLDLAAGAAQIKAGRLKALAVASEKRIAALPDVPTIAESGFPGFEASAWQGLVVPAGTPQNIVLRLNAVYGKTVEDPVLRQRIVDAGIEPLHSSPGELAAHMRSELDKWTRVISERNITIE